MGYRYVLSRPGLSMYSKEAVNFIMLNPSTATESVNDPTITRCINYAIAWGYGEAIITNLFALRSTDPEALYDHNEPIGMPDNQKYILEIAGICAKVVCAWGVHGDFRGRGEHVANLLAEKHDLYCLGVTIHGFPKHPLYLRGDVQPILFKAKGSK